jgi:phospholipid/cholesterol/gamma-HCH transport system permease protein
MLNLIKKTEDLFESLFVGSGGLTLLFLASMAEIRHLRRNMDRLLKQMLEVGFNTLPLASLIGLFVGMIMALETGLELKNFAMVNIVPDVVTLAIMREMGPVITAMISSGRVGAAMAAELGTMKVNEEIDALRSMGINPVRMLVMPRVLATMLMQPILTMYAIGIGIWGGSMVALNLFGIPQFQFWQSVYRVLEFQDVMFGLLKTVVFGAVYSTVSCYIGLQADRGAEGVGHATTRAVVLSLTLILVFDYIVGRFFG